MTPNSANGYDVIVVGSGPGGLTTAAFLATTGRKVLVLEQHDVAGGNCTVFRHNGYEFDVGLHYIGGCHPGGVMSRIVHALGLDDRIEFLPMDHDFDTLVFPDFTFQVPSSWSDYEDRLVERFPADAESIETYVSRMRGIAHEARNGPGELMINWGIRSLKDLLDDVGMSERPRAVVSYMSGLYGSGPADSAAAMHALVFDSYMHGSFFPKGGGQMIPARLVEVIEALGGRIKVHARVEQILIEDGAAKGVRLESGEEFFADTVVSNADYKRTMTELIPEGALAPEVVERARELPMTLPLVSAYIVLDCDLSETVPNTNFFCFPHYDVDSAYEGLESGEVEDDLFGVYLALGSIKDPTNRELCPPGFSNIQIMTIVPRGPEFWGLESTPTHGEKYRRNPRYLERKNKVIEQLISGAEHAIGPFRDHIVHTELSTPLTQERYTLSTDGTSYGLRHAPDLIGPFRPSYQTEIEGLYRVGANTESGHGINGTMSGGIRCAELIAGVPINAQVMAGEQLVDPAILPVDSQDWDPLHVSRGREMRERRDEDRAKRAVAKAATSS